MTAVLEDKPAGAAPAPEDTGGITELEKFDPSRVDGVDVPANGFPILMLKSIAIDQPPAVSDTIEEGHIAAAVTTEPATQNTVVEVDPSPPAPAPVAKASTETVMVELPADVSVSFSPRDLAKLNTLKRQLAVEQSALEGEAVKRDFDPNVGGGVDRDKIPTEDFADPEHRAFPIVSPKDVADINPNLNHGNLKGDPEKIKQRAIAIAHRKGPEFVAQIPDSWTDSGKGEGAKKSAADEAEEVTARATLRAIQDYMLKEQAAAVAEPAPETTADAHETAKAAKKPFPGAAPPFKKKDDAVGEDGGDETSSDSDDEDKDGDGAADGSGADGSDEDSNNEAKPAKKPAKTKKPKKSKAAKAMSCKSCEEPMAKDAKFCSACGAVADGEKTEKATKPFPADADVDQAIDQLERDADAALAAQAKDPDHATHPADRIVTEALDHVKDDVEAAAAAQDKDEATDTAAGHATKSADAPVYHLRRLHDATCAAFHTDDVIAAHPAVAKSIGHAADPEVFAGAISAALSGGDCATAAASLPALTRAYSHAAAIKAADPALLADAMDALRKAFADAYPDVHVKPGAITPGAFKRPYISAGRATETAAAGQKPRVPLTSHVPDPGDYKRPLITAGREASSPGSAVKDGRTYYTNQARDQAKGVLAAMHDYIAGQHPDLCPMSTGTYDGEDAKPGTMGTSLTTAAPTPERFGKTNAATAPVTVGAEHAASVVTPGPARKNKAARKKEKEMAKAAAQAAQPTAAPTPAVDEDMLTRVLSGVVAAQFGDLTKTIGELGQRITDLESAPDPEQMTPRAAAVALTKARNAHQEVPAGGDEAARTERLVRLVKQAKSPDQGIALPALDELMKTAGRELAVKLLE